MQSKTDNVLIGVSFVLFMISFFLPSYSNTLGYECAQYCLIDIWSDSRIVNSIDYLAVAYYVIFNIANLLMILTPIAMITGLYHKAVSQKIRLLFALTMTFFFLHVLSWWLLHLFSEVGLGIIQIGYYLWAISIGLLTFVVWKEKNRNCLK